MFLIETRTHVTGIGYLDSNGKWSCIIEKKRILFWTISKIFAVKFDESGNVTEKKQIKFYK